MDKNERYRQKHRQEINQRQLIYYYKNRDRYLDYKKDYYKTHKNKIRENNNNPFNRKRRADYSINWRKINPNYSKIKSKERSKQMRHDVLKYYSNNTLKCKNCGIKDIRALTLDHINGGGNKHRKSLGNYGQAIYRWIIKNNFPKEFQVLCINCNWIRHIEHIELGKN